MPSNHPRSDDTIVAVITPPGEGGIAVLRLSGADAIAAVDKVFHGKQPLALAASHTAHVGTLADADGGLLDEVVVTIFRAPHSYTAENVAEVSCHGSAFIAEKILNSFVRAGIRPAEPGEFTRRAFLNGRIDLSQAEAVAELIRSRSDAAHKASLYQLQGLHTNKFQELKSRILDLCSLLELELDFSEEGISLIETSTCEGKIRGLITDLSQLIDSYRFGKVYRDGIKVVLAGKPNVGKSSLLNALLNERRSIVTNISGTTRDTIEEAIRLSGYYVRVVDTAGLRETDDIVEQEGIRRTEAEIEDADVVAYIVDASSRDFQEDDARVRQLLEAKGEKAALMVVTNKIDLVGAYDGASGPDVPAGIEIFPVSAKSGSGIEELKKALSDRCFSGNFHPAEKSVVITNARHQANLVQARESLSKALETLRDGQSNEFVAVDLRSALRQIGEITGISTTEDVLNNIFANFCIGK
jgi:tRNA modification GTPase